MQDRRTKEMMMFQMKENYGGAVDAHTRSVSEQERSSLGSQAFLAIVHP